MKTIASLEKCVGKVMTEVHQPYWNECYMGIHFGDEVVILHAKECYEGDPEILELSSYGLLDLPLQRDLGIITEEEYDALSTQEQEKIKALHREREIVQYNILKAKYGGTND